MAGRLELENGTVIWTPSNVYDSASLGEDCSVGAFSEIGKNVIIGNRVRIGYGCFIPENVVIEDDVFIAPGAVFCNDKYPTRGDREEWRNRPPTVVCKNAVIGANATILPNLIIGEHAFVGAGSVVTHNIKLMGDGMGKIQQKCLVKKNY